MFVASKERSLSLAFRGAVAVLAVIGVLWGWRKWTEPRYLDRGVRSWIEQLPYDNSSNSEANEAMTYFGPRAVPYLIEATISPLKWDRGLLARIPRRYVARVVDLNHLRQVRGAAEWRLAELVREEIELTELGTNPEHPIADRV